MDDERPSKRNLIRKYAAEVLASAAYPVHVSRITELVRPRAAAGSGVAESEITQKTVNTSLHDDPLGRFESDGRGTWKLRRAASVPARPV